MLEPLSRRDNVGIYFGGELCFVLNTSFIGSLNLFDCGATERELSLKRKPSCGTLDEILRDCEVFRGGGDIPTTLYFFNFSSSLL